MAEFEYKNIRIKDDNSLTYYFGKEMNKIKKEVSKQEYELSKLPILKIESKK